MTYEKAFNDLKSIILKADTSTLEGTFAFQCIMTGESSGIFYIAFENNTLSIEPYDYADNTATFKASYEIYKNILTNKITVAAAIADGTLVVDGADSCADILTFFAVNTIKKVDNKPKATTNKKVATKTATKKSSKKSTKKKKPTVKKETSKVETKKESTSVKKDVTDTKVAEKTDTKNNVIDNKTESTKITTNVTNVETKNNETQKKS